MKRTKTMKTGFSFLILLLAGLSNTSAQEGMYELLRETEKHKVGLNEILGDWYTMDSTQSKITFIQRDNADVYIEGKRDAVNDYAFRIDGDSVQVMGVAANWPPYYSKLVLREDEVLEIRYFGFSEIDFNKVLYRRRKGE
jgi:hypothetical protein